MFLIRRSSSLTILSVSKVWISVSRILSQNSYLRFLVSSTDIFVYYAWNTSSFANGSMSISQILVLLMCKYLRFLRNAVSMFYIFAPWSIRIYKLPKCVVSKYMIEEQARFNSWQNTKLSSLILGELAKIYSKNTTSGSCGNLHVHPQPKLTVFFMYTSCVSRLVVESIFAGVVLPS